MGENWIYNLDLIKDIFYKNFKKMFSTENFWVPLQPSFEFNPPAVLNPLMVNSIRRVVIESEIFHALTGLSPLKALGPDGLSRSYRLKFFLENGKITWTLGICFEIKILEPN